MCRFHLNQACREPEAEISSRVISILEAEPEPAHADSDEDEDFNVQLCPRSHRRTRGHVAATIEEAPEEGQVTGSESLPALATIETAPSTSSQG